jgi:hypothetical protein
MEIEQTEAILAAELGLSRLAIARVRRRSFIEGVHWVKKEKSVRWTVAGIEGLKKNLGAFSPPGQENGQQEAAESLGEVVLLTISQVPKINRRILCARLKKGAQNEVRVRVKENQNFLPGMEIRARRDPLYQDVYNLEGRTPRYRGRW